MISSELVAKTQACIRRRWFLIVLIILVSRGIAIGTLNLLDVVNDSGISIKFMGPPAYMDYTFYHRNVRAAWDGLLLPFTFLGKALQDFHLALFELRGQVLKPGPVFPSLLGIFEYEFNKLPLAWAYLGGGCFLSYVWGEFLAWRGGHIFGQIALACFPSVIYYSLLVSTDLLYAVLIAALYMSALASSQSRYWAFGALNIVLVIAALTRPNALSMIPVAWWVIFTQLNLTLSTRLVYLAITGAFGSYMMVYYMPYLWVHEVNSLATNYFGIFPAQFREGIFTELPGWMNQIASLLLLAFSKLFYSVGLRPSYADINPWLTIARALPGLLYLPGMVYGFWRGQQFDKVFMFFFILPVYVGAAQERYLLPVTPLLVFWGFKAYADVWGSLKSRWYDE